MSKRENKSKEQIQREMMLLEKQKAHIAKEKYIAKTVFPLVENMKTVYDAQTAFNAASGYIQYALAVQQTKILVRDLAIAVEKKSNKEVADVVEKILNSMSDVPAKDVGDLLERMGQKLAEYVANKGLKEPMTIKASDFISE